MCFGKSECACVSMCKVGSLHVFIVIALLFIVIDLCFIVIELCFLYRVVFLSSICAPRHTCLDCLGYMLRLFVSHFLIDWSHVGVVWFFF